MNINIKGTKVQLIVGLGNPGRKYVHTRHNIGFIILARLAQKYNFKEAKQTGKNMLSTGQIEGRKVILAWPQTFMNLSGEGASEVANYYKIKADDILVVHDDLDLLPGRIKLVKGGGTAGHNGLISMYQYLSGGFDRLKFGIGRPQKSIFPSGTANFVLAPFADSEVPIIDEAAHVAAEAITLWLSEGLVKAQDIFNKRN